MQSTQAQILNPVKWEASIEKKSDSEYFLTLNGAIEKDWHVYSQFTPEDGPLPAEFLFHDKKTIMNLLEKQPKVKPNVTLMKSLV